MSGWRAPALVAAGVGALLLVAYLAMPGADGGPPPSLAPAPVVSAPEPPPPPSPPPRIAPVPPGLDRPDLAALDPDAEERPRPSEPWEPPPLDRIYRAEARGLGEALLARRDHLRDCWGAFRERSAIGEEEAGRFTVELSVARGEPPEAAIVSGASDAELEACVAEAVADARFEEPATGRVSIVWPVPIAALPGEP